MRVLYFCCLASVSVAAALLTGCAFGPAANGTTAGPLAMTGTVHGGQQGVSGAQVFLYTAGTSGNGSAATNLLTVPVFTDVNGSFSITGDYACPHYNDQVYALALGGNPGGAAGTTNPALAMMTAVGPCGDLLANAANRYISINEITTAAAAWALAPFMSGPASVGSSATNASGLANAMLDAALLANPGNGAVATNANGVAIESGKLLALADALASCVNTAGGSGCSPLFSAATPPSGSAPSDTLTAALNIVKNPSYNVAAVFNLVSSTSPYPTPLTQAPKEWTMSLTVPLPAPPNNTGSGNPYSAAPTSLDIDANGTVWVAGYYGILNGVNPQGALLSGTGFGIGALKENYGLTIDTGGNVWLANEESSANPAGDISKFQGSLGPSPGALLGTYHDSSINYPYGLSASPNGNIFIANYVGSSATEYSSAGVPVATLLGSPNSNFPVAVAADANGGVWLANLSDMTVTHVDANNNLLARPACCNGADALATDAAGNVWVSNYDGSSFSEVSAAGATLINQSSVGGVAYPAGISVDAGGTVWVANYRNQSISAISSGTVPGEPAAGTAVSPAAGLGLDAHLLLPYALIPDRSGNLWVSNFGNNDLVVFLGLATPTSTPTLPTPTAP